MKQAVLELLSELNEKNATLRTYLEGYSAAQLHALAAPEKWSAIMTVHHLILAETGSLAYCKKKLSFNPELEEATDEQKRMETKVPYLLRSPKYKVDAPPGLSAEFLNNEWSLEEIFELWNMQRKELAEFLQNQPDVHFTKALYKHPLGGKMRLIGMLMFFDGHHDSHTTQIKDNFESMANA